MRKGFIISSMVVALLFAPAVCAQVPADQSRWEGKTPHENGVFWDDPAMKSIMKKNIPTELIEKITKGWIVGQGNVEAPIEQQGDVVGVFVCKPHECASYAARLYVNLVRQTAQLCWMEELKAGTTLDVWIADDVKRLPDGACSAKGLWENLAGLGKTGY